MKNTIILVCLLLAVAHPIDFCQACIKATVSLQNIGIALAP